MNNIQLFEYVVILEKKLTIVKTVDILLVMQDLSVIQKLIKNIFDFVVRNVLILLKKIFSLNQQVLIL